MKQLLSNAKIFDGLGQAFEGHALLIDGDRIERVAKAAEFAGFDGKRQDLSGASILPGLIDCHVHLCYAGEAHPSEVAARLQPGQVAVRALKHARDSLQGGITAVRDCGGVNYLEFAARDACNERVFQGPTIRAAGRMICMTGGHGNRFGRVADGVDEVIKGVREQIHAGSDLVKIMATGGVMTKGVNPEDAHYSAEEMAAGIAEGHRFHKTCASHAQGTEGILNAVRGGIDSIEHGIFMTEQSVEEMVLHGTYLVPTFAALFNILQHPEKVPDYVIDKTERVAEFHKRSIRMFYKAGGKIAMGTDAGTPFNLHGENARELAFMVKDGISEMDAIRFSTSNAADLMRLEDQGRVIDGAAADLLVVNGDPEKDIRCVAETEHHRFVMKHGQVVVG